MKRYRIAILASMCLLFAGCASSTTDTNADALANGKAIFTTGRDSQGLQMTAQKPPLMPSCQACHGANGAGGVHLPGGAVSADLRYSALISGQKHPYTIALLERAISTGIDDDGDALNPVMPRWNLSKQDLHDVAYYVLHALK
ncbi:MAG: c-type cytochrome [Vulcanimicrobiaceae bacterium]